MNNRNLQAFFYTWLNIQNMKHGIQYQKLFVTTKPILNRFRYQIKPALVILLFLAFVLLIGTLICNKLGSLNLMILNHKYDMEDSNESHDFMIKWPPQDLNHLLDPKTGTYDLTLPVYVAPFERTTRDRVEAYVNYLKMLNSTPSDGRLSLRQLVELDEQVRIGHNYPNFMLYPQALDLRETVELVRQGKLVNHAPINNPKLKIHRLPRHVCNPNQSDHANKLYDLIVIIKSCVFCVEERTNARQTFMQPQLWSKRLTIGFLFMLGQPVFEKTIKRTFDSYTIRTENRLPQSKSASEAMHNLEKESDLHGDMLIGSFEDTYFNLTLKQMTLFRWAAIFCQGRSKLFMVMDHDRSVIPENVEQFIKTIPENMRPNVVFGLAGIDTDIVHRPYELKQKTEKSKHIAKWVVSENEFPWSWYPPYVPGPSYVLGAEVVNEVSIGHVFTKRFRMEDVFLGIVLFKLQRLPVAHAGFLRHRVQLTELGNAICLPKDEADRLYDWIHGRPKTLSKINRVNG